jgi:hypothetical protein
MRRGGGKGDSFTQKGFYGKRLRSLAAGADGGVAVPNWPRFGEEKSLVFTPRALVW